MYLTCLARSDDVLVANAHAMLPRLKRIRGDCRPPDKSAFHALADCITDLLHPSEFSTFMAGIGGDDFDPMRSVPLRAFSIRPDSGDTDQCDCWIRAVAATRDGSKLVMTDWNNRNVKVAELADPEAASHYTVRQYRGVCSVDEDEMIIVSCRNDKDGRVVSRLAHPELREPHQVAADKNV
nr:hypothetical protein BaRGS_002138 [Batillaria attramentaria]